MLRGPRGIERLDSPFTSNGTFSARSSISRRVSAKKVLGAFPKAPPLWTVQNDNEKNDEKLNKADDGQDMFQITDNTDRASQQKIQKNQDDNQVGNEELNAAIDLEELLKKTK